MSQLLRISILLNLVLALGAAWLLRPASPATEVMQSGHAEKATIVASKPVEEATNIVSASEVAFVTNAFHWQQLEATNYDEFVSNLRAVGCPPRTIRDIIFADAVRRYADLQVLAPEPASFWLAGKARRETELRNETARTAAQDALRMELQRLFGVEWGPEEAEIDDVRFQVLSRLIIGPVSEAEYERTWRWFMTLMESSQRFRQQRGNLWLSADKKEWEGVVALKNAQLEKILPLQAHEEFRARTTFLEELFESKALQLKYLELTPIELRAACLVKIKEVGWLEDAFEMDRNQSKADVEAKKLALALALKDVLAADHFTEFLRVQEDGYRNLLETVRVAQVPRSAAQKVYDLRQSALAEYAQLPPETTAAERADALKLLQTTTGDAARKILGAELFAKFITQNGPWYTNFGKL